MRVLVRRLLAPTIVSGAALLACSVLAQPDSAPAEAPEEVTVTGRRSLAEYRLELERARNEIFRIFNEANAGRDTDVRCRNEQPTGSRMRQSVCRSDAENRASASAARDFLGALLASAGNFITNSPTPNSPTPPPGGPQVNAAIGTGEAQADAVAGEAGGLAAFEAEFRRVMAANQELYSAVVRYAELENEYNVARGAAPIELDVPLAAAPVRAPVQQCEATTLTEYQQRGGVARVSATVSIGGCTAGTTGGFTLVARVRDDAGETKTIDFNETWQRDDAQDVRFESDYPIGDNVDLMSVRVRNLQCTCAAAASAAPAP